MREHSIPGAHLRRGCALLGLAVLLAAAGIARAEPMTREEVPEPLRPWIGWVLRDRPSADCPFALGDSERVQCAWSGPLELDLAEREGRFRQSFELYRRASVALPGTPALWPEDVYANGRPAAVVEEGGVPVVQLTPGRYQISGRLRYTAMPELVPIPAETGIVSLRLRGQLVPFPRREPATQLWLGAAPQTRTRAEGRVEVSVHRRLIDEVPLELDTRIDLQVSGPERELQIAGVLPAGFSPSSIDAPVPARITPDGTLQVQLRAGRFAISIGARHSERDPQIGYPAVRGPWDAEETWVFESRPALRTVDVEGLRAVDPQQTELPQEWRSLPAYAFSARDRLKLVERTRGDAEPRPDRLQLARTLWLDFDGGGYTAQDHIQGELARSWRLETGPGVSLGRAGIDGVDQWVTRLGEDANDGVELRQGQLYLIADLRVDGEADLAASGWQHDFDSIVTSLRLPPGWRLLHAGGPEGVRDSWVSSWTLLGIFLALIGALATAQLFGAQAGAIALATFVLTFPELGAPRYAWLIALTAIALERALGGRLTRSAALARHAALALLAWVALPFAIQHARLALHPSLERSGWDAAMQPADSAEGGALDAYSAAQRPAGLEEITVTARKSEALLQAEPARAREARAERPSSPPTAAPVPSPIDADRLQRLDPDARVSTGPGIPAWSWTETRLTWQGPVGADEELSLWLAPPWLNRALGWLRLALIAWLAATLVRAHAARPSSPERPSEPPPRTPVRPQPGRAARTAFGIALAAGALASAPARADFPSPDQLAELGARLSEPPSCAPQCASSPRMRLEVDETRLAARIQIDAAWNTAVPLPGSLSTWSPARVLVDNGVSPTALSQRDGTLWLALRPGTHDIYLDGPLPDTQSIDLPLPLPPNRIEVAARGWSVDGVRDDRVTGTLRLQRARPSSGGAPAAARDAQALPGFARVERTLELGLTWSVVTRVRRLTPPGAPILLDVPLLPGESVISSEVEVSAGVARVNLAPGQDSIQWSSLLVPGGKLELAPPASLRWSEAWRLAVSPIWHVEVSGIPAVHDESPAPGRVRVREWRPWPNDKPLSIRIARPSAAPGQTLTIDRSAVDVRTGERATDLDLRFALRSSRGETHVVRFPESARLVSVSIDGRTQPLRLEQAELKIPVRPGNQEVQIQWQWPAGAGILFRVPRVDLGAPSVNAQTVASVPENRWPLLTGGPRLGPVVLFWGLLAVLIGVSVALGRIEWVPLGTGEWLLLLVGLTQVPLISGAIFAGWLLALGLRRRAAPSGPLLFDAVQIGLALWTLVALGILLLAVQEGLLGRPEMQIAGNGSSGAELRWYQDRSGGTPDSGWVLWAPLWLYRLAMLAWALWLARALLGWLRWGWECFQTGGLWRPRTRISVPGI